MCILQWGKIYSPTEIFRDIFCVLVELFALVVAGEGNVYMQMMKSRYDQMWDMFGSCNHKVWSQVCNVKQGLWRNIKVIAGLTMMRVYAYIDRYPKFLLFLHSINVIRYTWKNILIGTSCLSVNPMQNIGSLPVV